LALQLEDFIGWAGEDTRKDEGKFEAGDVAVAFDGVDALAGDADSLSQLLLCPTAGVAEVLDSVCDSI